MTPGIDPSDQKPQPPDAERPKGDPRAGLQDRPLGGGQGISSGLHPGGTKPHGGDFGGVGSLGTGGGGTGPGAGLGGESSRTPDKR